MFYMYVRIRNQPPSAGSASLAHISIPLKKALHPYQSSLSTEYVLAFTNAEKQFHFTERPYGYILYHTYLARQPEPEAGLFSPFPFSITPSPIVCISVSHFLHRTAHYITKHAIACCLIELNAAAWLCCRANITKSDHPELGRPCNKK